MERADSVDVGSSSGASSRPADDRPASSGAWRRLHPLTIAHNVAGAVPSLLLVSVPVWMGTGGRGQLVSAFALAAASALLFGPVVAARYLRFRYRLSDAGVEVESGLFSRQHRVLPYDRVQAVEVERPPLARLFGTARVLLMTGSGSGAEATLAFVSNAEAERLRRVLRDARAAAGDRPVPLDGPLAPAPDDPSEEAVRFVLTPPRLVRAGLYRVSLAYLAVVYSALQIAGLQPDDLRELAYDSRLAPVRALVGGHPALSAASFVALGLLIAWVAGIATTVLRYAGFVLADDGRRLHTRGGLLSRWTRTLPRGRVQAFVRRSHAPMRRAGFVRLDVQMLGSSGSESGAGGSLDALAPLATDAEADALVAAVRPLAPVEAWQPPSPRHARRLALRYLVPAVLVPVAAAWASPWALAGLALVPVALVVARAQARAHRYALTADALHVESGAFWRVRRSVPRDRAQAVSRSATWTQRRAGLATVVLDTAAGPGRGLRVRDLDADIAARLVADLRGRTEPMGTEPMGTEPVGSEPLAGHDAVEAPLSEAVVPVPVEQTPSFPRTRESTPGPESTERADERPDDGSPRSRG